MQILRLRVQFLCECAPDGCSARWGCAAIRRISKMGVTPVFGRAAPFDISVIGFAKIADTQKPGFPPGRARRNARLIAGRGFTRKSATGAGLSAAPSNDKTAVETPAKDLDHARLLRSGRRSQSDQGQEGRDGRLRQPGPRACAQPARQRRKGHSGGAASEFALGQEGGRRRHEGARRRQRGQMGRHRHDADAGRIAGRHLPQRTRAQHDARRRADVRPRPEHPLQPDRAARRHRRADGRAQGSGPYRALGVQARRRRALPDRDPPGRQRQRARSRAVLRLGDRRRPLRRDRDQFPRGMRDRPVRRAGGPVRRPGRADPRRVRDPGRAPATRRKWPISSACTR